MAEHKNLIVGQHYPAIDGLRGVAVLLVLWFHSSYFAYEMNPVNYSGFTQIYYYFSILGQTGVDLFFVLSGFLITGILIDTAQDERRFLNFYIRRSLRVFPLYYAVLFLFIIYVLFFHGVGYFDLRLLTHLFYLQNWSFDNNFDAFMMLNHTWSLAVEEQFYLFWPVLFLAVYKHPLKYILTLCLFLILTSWMLRFLLSELGHYKLAYSITICRLDDLALGALLSILCVHYRDIIMKNRVIFSYGIVVFSAFVCFILLSAETTGVVNGSLIKIGLSFCSVLYFCLLARLFLSDENDWMRGFLSLSFLRKIGQISYGMYIFHVPILVFIGMAVLEYNLSYWNAHLLLLVIGGGSSFILASLSYRYFEKPVLNLKYKYAPLREANEGRKMI